MGTYSRSSGNNEQKRRDTTEARSSQIASTSMSISFWMACNPHLRVALHLPFLGSPQARGRALLWGAVLDRSKAREEAAGNRGERLVAPPARLPLHWTGPMRMQYCTSTRSAGCWHSRCTWWQIQDGLYNKNLKSKRNTMFYNTRNSLWKTGVDFMHLVSTSFFAEIKQCKWGARLALWSWGHYFSILLYQELGPWEFCCHQCESNQANIFCKWTFPRSIHMA